MSESTSESKNPATLTVVHQDLGEVDVVFGLAENIAAEEKFGIGPSDLETPQIKWMAYMAWHAIRRTSGPDGVGKLPFEKWWPNLLSIEGGEQPASNEDETEADPEGNG